MAKQRARKRAGNDEPYDPLAVPVEGANRTALRSYRLGIWSLIPFVGLILGPLAATLGLAARWRGRNDPEFTFHAPALAGIVLGGLVAVTNWTGVVLMVLGAASG
jgi:hypothetical protein